MNRYAVSIVAGSLLFLAACTPNVNQLTLDAKEVKLKIRGNPKRLDIDEPPTKKCTGVSEERQRGCIIAELNQLTERDFRLLQAGQFHLTQFEVCPGQNKRADTSQPCSLDDTGRKEFIISHDLGVAMPDANGLVDLTQFSADVEEFTLINKNSVRGDYFYRIQACPDGETSTHPDCIWTDPPVRNKGRGRL